VQHKGRFHTLRSAGECPVKGGAIHVQQSGNFLAALAVVDQLPGRV
jgi:hypothetical protein